MKTLNLHLVSDSTGETVRLVAKACLVQFENITVNELDWTMIRTAHQMEKVIKGIEAERGFVLYTLVNPPLRQALEDGCRKLQIPCIPVLDPVVAALGGYLGAEVSGRPGRQHVMDAEYFTRIEAMHYVLAHDDGQSPWDLDQADIIVVGVSRTSKTPTCMYLANRGIRAANVPVVPGCTLPPEMQEMAKNGPMTVGLTCDPKTLVQIRKTRLKMLSQDDQSTYVDLETVTREVNETRRLFADRGWMVIDVTRKSIEEISATILKHYHQWQETRE